MGLDDIGRLEFPGGRSFAAVIGNLLLEETDCIVNAANGMLAHGGGVAAAILRAAGRELDEDGRRIIRERGPIPVGEAVVTTAGRLPFKGVVHVVGPCSGDGDEGEKLKKALLSGFARAEERGWGSLSFPAVSSGIFAVPLDVCAKAYVEAAVEFFTRYPGENLKIIRLVLLDGPIVGHVRREIEAARTGGG
ncbi:MAG: macro domain-containing protein [Planctomycetota bacterium]|nr:macro domain-containing protein [Planctomycetota bacterium]